MLDLIAYQSMPRPRSARSLPLAIAKRVLVLFWTGLLWLGTAQVAPMGAQAQVEVGGAPSKADEVTYERLIDRALSAYQKRDFRTARQLFAEAHLLWPNARTLRGLGMADFELGEYVTAKQHLQEALNNGVKPLTRRLRTATKQLLNRAESNIGTLVILTDPLQLKLTVGTTPFDYASGTPIELTAGSHALHLSAPGYLDRNTEVDIQGGLTTELKFYLAELPDAAPAANLAIPKDSASGPYDPSLPTEQPAGTPPRDDDDGSVLESPWLWVGVGVLVAATTASVILLSSNGDDSEGVEVLQAPNWRF